jgi:hypothetical protein
VVDAWGMITGENTGAWSSAPEILIELACSRWNKVPLQSFAADCNV